MPLPPPPWWVRLWAAVCDAFREEPPQPDHPWDHDERCARELDGRRCVYKATHIGPCNFARGGLP